MSKTLFPKSIFLESATKNCFWENDLMYIMNQPDVYLDIFKKMEWIALHLHI